MLSSEHPNNQIAQEDGPPLAITRTASLGREPSDLLVVREGSFTPQLTLRLRNDNNHGTKKISGAPTDNNLKTKRRSSISKASARLDPSPNIFRKALSMRKGIKSRMRTFRARTWSSAKSIFGRKSSLSSINSTKSHVKSKRTQKPSRNAAKTATNLGDGCQADKPDFSTVTATIRFETARYQEKLQFGKQLTLKNPSFLSSGEKQAPPRNPELRFSDLPAYAYPIPSVLVELKDALISRGGLSTLGIFRLCPNKRKLARLRHRLISKKPLRISNDNISFIVPKSTTEKQNEAEEMIALAHLVKSFYLELPTPVLSEDALFAGCGRNTTQDDFQVSKPLTNTKKKKTFWSDLNPSGMYFVSENCTSNS
jgi:hypothetical protein